MYFDNSVHAKVQNNSRLPTASKTFQESLDKFVPVPSVSMEGDYGTLAVKPDWVANKVANLVLDRIKPVFHNQVAIHPAASHINVSQRVVKATNLQEFVEEVPEFSILGEKNSCSSSSCSSMHQLL